MTDFYLDNAATSAVLPCAANAAAHAMTEVFANPSSIHLLGRRARELVDRARDSVANAMTADSTRVFFTSGATESINTALLTGARKNRHIGRHILSTKIEHEATLSALNELKSRDFEVSLISPKRSGGFDVESFIDALRPDTSLVTMLAVCNETGTNLPYAEVSAAVKQRCPGALFHLDAVQAFCKQPLDLLNIDMLSVSAHKIGGVKGCGALYIRRGLNLSPIIFGGGQESGLRSGTEGVPQIAAFGQAAEFRMQSLAQNNEHFKALRTRLLQGLSQLPFETAINSPEGGSPHIVNISPERGRSEVYIRQLESFGVYVSGGSACHSGKRSHVLTAMGLPAANVGAALRISFCPESTFEQVDAFLSAYAQAYTLF